MRAGVRWKEVMQVFVAPHTETSGHLHIVKGVSDEENKAGS